jgi:hypothetical protein
VLRSLRRACDGVAERHGRRAAGAPKALAVALSFCRLLGLGCPKQAFAKIATPRGDRHLGSLDLPMVRLDYEFTGYTKAEMDEFIEHLNEHMMRLGG